MSFANTKVHLQQGGEELVVESGGVITVKSGGAINLEAGGVIQDDGTQATAIADLTDSSGGATANGTIEVVTAPTAFTDNSGGAADATLAACGTAVTGVDGAGSNAASKADVDTRLTAIANNFADLAARQAENRAAIVSLTNAVKELATKVNAMLAAMRGAGTIASS